MGNVSPEIDKKQNFNGKLNGTCGRKEGSSTKFGVRFDLIGGGSVSFFNELNIES